MNNFKIPFRTEVAKYIQDKMGWPPEFCKYYADRFWDFYNSNGWKVSGKAPMKNWQSAFNSQWQKLKFPEDIAELAKYQSRAPAPQTNSKQTPFQRLDYLMNMYTRDGDSVSTETLVKVHDWLKERELLHIQPDQEQMARDVCKDNPERLKAIRVKFMFTNMKGRNESFTSMAAKRGPTG